MCKGNSSLFEGKAQLSIKIVRAIPCCSLWAQSPALQTGWAFPKEKGEVWDWGFVVTSITWGLIRSGALTALLHQNLYSNKTSLPSQMTPQHNSEKPGLHHHCTRRCIHMATFCSLVICLVNKRFIVWFYIPGDVTHSAGWGATLFWENEFRWYSI